MISSENQPKPIPSAQQPILPPPKRLSFPFSLNPARTSTSSLPPVKTSGISLTSTAAATPSAGTSSLLATCTEDGDLGNANKKTASVASYADDNDDNGKSIASQDPDFLEDRNSLPLSSPTFSIRDHVFAARSNDVSRNWPFSKKSFLLCLEHGVKDLLPPFEQRGSYRNKSIRRSSVCKDTPCEIPSSTSDKNSSNNQLVSHSIDLGAGQEPSLAQKHPLIKSREIEKDLESNSNNPCQSMLESASTSKPLPSSDICDRQEVVAPAALPYSNDSILSPSHKRKRSLVKVGSKFDHKLSEGTSTMSDLKTAPGEVMASKVCPVCGTFSSSSNTTLNAHIDQCLSVNTSPDKAENDNEFRMPKPRIKPRKIRLMADICATAKRCTLEDLDRRNGTNWVSDANDLRISQAADAVSGEKQQRVMTRQIRGSADNMPRQIRESADNMPRQIGETADDTPRQIRETADDSPRQIRETAADITMRTRDRAGDMPRQNRNMSRQNSDRTGVMPRQNRDRTGDMPRQNRDSAGDMPRQNRDSAGDMSRQNSSNAGNMSRQIGDGAVDKEAVYIDETGTKIRILSYFGNAPSPLKPTADLRMKKPLKDTPRKLLPNKEESLAKDPRHFKQISPRKEFSLQSCSLKARGTNAADIAAVGRKREAKDVSPVIKPAEQKKLSGSGMLTKWVRSKRTSFPRRSIISRIREHTVPGTEEMRTSSTDSDQLHLGESRLIRSDSIRHSSVSENCTSSSKSSLQADEVSDDAGSDDNWCSPKRKRFDAPLSRGPRRARWDSSDDVAAENNMVVIQSADRSLRRSRTARLLRSLTSDGREPHSSEKDVCPPSSSSGLSQQLKADENASFLTCHLNRVSEEMVEWSVGAKDATCEAFDHVGSLRSEICNDGESPTVSILDKTVERLSDFHEYATRFDSRLGTGERDDHSLIGHEASGPRREHAPPVAEDAAGRDKRQFNVSESEVNVGSYSSFLVIDPIPIPGPPGSDLPSPRDMDSEVLPASPWPAAGQNLCFSNPKATNQVQCFNNPKDMMIDADSTDSPSSATTTISNFAEAGVSDHSRNSEPCMESHLVVDHERGWGERHQSVPSSVVDGRFDQEKAPRWPQNMTVDVGNSNRGITSEGNRSFVPAIASEPCRCSWKEGVSWNAGFMRAGDHHGRQPICPVPTPMMGRQMIINERATGSTEWRAPAEKLVGSTISSRGTAASGIQLPSPSDSESPSSVSPSTLVFRLMGKDLTIINNDRSTSTPAWAQPVFSKCSSNRASRISGI